MNILLYPIGFFFYTGIIHPLLVKVLRLEKDNIITTIIFILMTYGMFVVYFFTDNDLVRYWYYFVSFPSVVGSFILKLINKK